MTFTSVVLCNSIQLGFLVAVLNKLEVLSTEISGAYLNVKAAEKVYMTPGKEFGPKKAGSPVLIVCML